MHYTGDETWVYYSTPETRKYPWPGNINVPLKHNKLTLAGRKIVETVYWDHTCAFIVNFLECGDTVTTEHYCGTLRCHGCFFVAKYTICAIVSRLTYRRPKMRLTMALELGSLYHPPTLPISRRVISFSLDLLKSTWLARNLQQTPTWSKLSSLDCRRLKLISSMAQYKHWCHSGTNSQLSLVTTWSCDMYYL
jgi:hypothetical protein